MSYYFFFLFLLFNVGQNKSTSENQKKLLLQADSCFAAESVKYGSAEAFYKYLSSDAIQLPAGKQPIFGNKNIYLEMLPANDKYILNWTPQDGDVSGSCEMGWTWGFYYVSLSENPDSIISNGKYLNVWVKDEKDNWKVKIDMGNSNP